MVTIPQNSPKYKDPKVCVIRKQFLGVWGMFGQQTPDKKAFYPIGISKPMAYEIIPI